MTRGRRGSSGLRALLLGLGVPALALFGLFSLIPYERMTGDWPVGISAEEVHFYQRWFDQRPDSMAVVEVERFDLDSSGTCMAAEGEAAAWRRFSAPDHGDSANVRRLGDEAWIISFPSSRPFRGQHALILRPADMSSIRALYAAAIAKDIGLIAARTQLVRLWSCGDDQGLFLAEEAITQELVGERGAPGAVLLDPAALAQADSTVSAEARAAIGSIEQKKGERHMDAGAAAAWGLLVQATEGSTGHGAAWFEPDSRRVIPVLGGSGADSSMGDDLLQARLALADARAAMASTAERLRADSATWDARLAEVDAASASAFVSDTRIGYVRAQLGQERRRFLSRLFHPDAEGRSGPATPMSTEAAAASAELDPWLRKYVVGDTIRFPRGKYTLDHLITVPPGKGVVLEKGARFNMEPGSGLIVNGELHMRGTGLNPVFIRPKNDNEPWAGICVNGTGSTRCVITGLKMSGGSQAPEHAAMLSFRDCQVSIASSNITEAKGPAGVSVVRGSLRMNGSVLGAGREALVSLVFAKADFNTCTFMGSSTPVGLHAKGSAVRLQECGFSQFTSSALLAELKSRTLLQGASFSKNRTALMIQDGAEAHVDGSHFKENATALAAQRSKPGDAGGRIHLYQNTFEGNSIERQIDAVSRVGTGLRPEASLISSFDLAGK